MKRVNSILYNEKYFNLQTVSPDFNKPIKPQYFNKKYKEISSLVNLTTSDYICDYGCGTGDLSFLISLKYRCHVCGIDYSSSAINICQNKLKLFKKNTNPKPSIMFLNKDNSNLPKLSNIKAVYFCDVFEHLYPKEIKQVIKNISIWGNPIIVVHTDNNNYLKYIQPIINIFSVICGNTTLKKIKQNNKFHQKRHVNLTNPFKLKKEMARMGYYQTKLQYPKVNKNIIKKQLGPLSKFNFLVLLSFYTLKLFPIFFPSFYSVYSKNHISS